MSGVRDLLNIAKSALFTQQAGVNIAGHNIANVNTEGYSKQEADLYMIPGVKERMGLFGNGVDISSIRQRQTQFADRRLFQENSRMGEWKAREKTLHEIEGLFYGVGENDLNVKLNNFFNAWEDISSNPESPEFRIELVQATNEMTDKFHTLDTSFQEIRTNLNGEVEANVDQVNEILKKIHALNDQIAKIEFSGDMANDLRDQRRLFIRDLSEFMNIEIQEAGQGKIRVMHQGITMVGKEDIYPLSTQTTLQDGKYLTDVYGSGREFKFKAGTFAGLIEVRDDVLGGYQNTIDNLAREVAQQVNKIHEIGFDLDGNLGGNFFHPGKLTAGSIEIRSDFEENLDRIAAASGSHDWATNTHISNGVGDNATALKMATLRNIKLLKEDTATFEEVYNTMYAQIGFDSKEAQDNVRSTQVLVDQIDNYRETVAGVSLDEEITEMMSFQSSYAAASRLVNVADRMFQTLLEMTR